MKDFTQAGRKAVTDGNLYAALSIALMLPDICGALETPGVGVGDRYKRWFNTCAAATIPYLTGNDCYKLRNSLLHQGRAELATNRSSYQHVEFFDRSTAAHANIFSGNVTDGIPDKNYIQLRADIFSTEMFDAVDAWIEKTATDPGVQEESKSLLRIRTAGDSITTATFGGILPPTKRLIITAKGASSADLKTRLERLNDVIPKLENEMISLHEEMKDFVITSQSVDEDWRLEDWILDTSPDNLSLNIEVIDDLLNNGLGSSGSIGTIPDDISMPRLSGGHAPEKISENIRAAYIDHLSKINAVSTHLHFHIDELKNEQALLSRMQS